MKSFRTWHLAALLAITMVACGSGGGGSDGDGGKPGLSYSGKTSKAKVTEQNAVSVTTGAYKVGESGSAMAFMSTVETAPAGNSGEGGSMSLSVVESLQSIVQGVEVKSVTLIFSAKVRESDTINGDCGGNAALDVTVDDQTGKFNGTMKFTKFCSDGVIFSGNTTFSGKINLTTEEMERFKFNFEELRCSYNGESFTLRGDLSFNFTSQSLTALMNILLKDNRSGKVYKLDDYKVSISEEWNYVDAVVTGKYYDPDYGYVVISTIDPLRIYDGDGWPSEGTLLCQGRDGTKARLQVISDTAFMVEADTNGDGTYDYDSGTLYWADI